MTRVVSLVPSVTETLLAWEVQPIACTRFCEQPSLPHIGGTKDPDIAAIVDLAPDLVVMCDEENRREDADALIAAGLAVHSCSPRSVGEVAPALDDLAEALGVTPTGAGASAPVEPLGRRAFVPIWRRPWMTMNGETYGSSVLEWLGVVNVFADAGDRYPEVDLDAARAARPDVVLAPTEPYPFKDRHLAELGTVAPAVLVDGQDLFWWGVRTPRAVARLHEQLASLS
ncbi:MAG: cobalamin-binding protein [Acidimicrobiia bacterium]|nr:cobalamin-binding protein [Acidimicrobiia bacterium]